MEYGLLLYNLRTFKGLKLYKTNTEEYEHFKRLLECSTLDSNDSMVQSLYSGDFVVDDDRDEFQEVKTNIKHMSYFQDNSLDVTVLVTDNCNFKCQYCFKKAKVQDFSDENWDNLYKYLSKELTKDAIKYVRICFYGGEPLLKVNKILNFMQRLNSYIQNYPNKEVCYHMITNAYLLTPEIYDKLTKNGMTFFQITIDGFEEEHNKMRPLVNGQGTWQKIMDNLKYINSVEDNLHIALRFNCAHDKIVKISEYKSFYGETLPNKKFQLQFEPISNFSDLVNNDLVVDDKDDLYEMYLQSELPQMFNGIKFPPGFVQGGHRCKYAYDNNITINTDGRVFRCEDCDNDNTCVGHLGDNGQIVYDVDIEQWLTRFEKEECKTCIMYPICFAQSCLNRDKCQSLQQDFEQYLHDIQIGKYRLC